MVAPDIKPKLRLSEAQLAHLGGLTDEWHIWADLSFADLVLWVYAGGEQRFYAVAQIRPATGPTALEDDIVGQTLAWDPANLVTQAYQTGQIQQTSQDTVHAGVPVDIGAIPLMVSGQCWGVVQRQGEQLGIRAPGELEDHYLVVADQLADMAWRGVFPDQGHRKLSGMSPRVGEGLLTLDENGVVDYASPNAVSAFRKLGLTSDLVGEPLVPLARDLTTRPEEPVETSLAAHFRSARSDEVELDNGECLVFLHILPLTNAQGRVGTLVVLRDTTELRQRERQLVTKDATIREIHHRVKNNLQTVSALLRLQARRMRSSEAATALNEAMARVQSIAVVHEILSYSMSGAVDFDGVADRLLTLAADFTIEGGRVAARRQGSFGEVPAEVATSLALVLTELCTNAIEHGIAAGCGELVLEADRGEDGWLRMAIIDNGEGLPADFSVDDPARVSLGLSIVTTLLQDLRGSFRLESNPDGVGARASVAIPL